MNARTTMEGVKIAVLTLMAPSSVPVTCKVIKLGPTCCHALVSELLM